MADVKDMYRLAKFIDSKKYDAILVGKITAENSLVNLADTFSDHYHCYLILYSRDKALRIIAAAEDLGYLFRTPDKNLGIVFHVSYPKGHHLLGKTFFLFRTGLWDESLKHYKSTKEAVQQLIIPVVVAIIGSNTIIAFITYWLSRR